MKRTVGQHTDADDFLKILGDSVADGILKDVEKGKMKVTDDMFLKFLPCIFADGNVAFLRVIADECFTEKENIELVNVFLDYVEVMLKKGERLLRQGK